MSIKSAASFCIDVLGFFAALACFYIIAVMGLSL